MACTCNALWERLRHSAKLHMDYRGGAVFDFALNEFTEISSESGQINPVNGQQLITLPTKVKLTNKQQTKETLY
jgi:hypothetical protein